MADSLPKAQPCLKTLYSIHAHNLQQDLFMPEINSETTVFDYHRMAETMMDQANVLLAKANSTPIVSLFKEVMDPDKDFCPEVFIEADEEVFKDDYKIIVFKPKKITPKDLFSKRDFSLLESAYENLPLKREKTCFKKSNVQIVDPERLKRTLEEELAKISTKGMRSEIVFSGDASKFVTPILKGNLIPQVDLYGELPKPKEFVPALLKVLGQLTNNTADKWVNYNVVLEPVIRLVGIDPDDCPWPLRGKDPSSVARNITYAYRNNKEGYRSVNALFKKTEVSKVWALTDYGVQQAKLYNPDGASKLDSLEQEDILVSEDATKVLYPILAPGENRSSLWIIEQGANLSKDLVSYASRRFSISYNIGLIEDHVNEFLCELVEKDKIGRFFDRHGLWPEIGEIKGWMTRNIITQIRKNGREPVCMSLHGALSKRGENLYKKVSNGEVLSKKEKTWFEVRANEISKTQNKISIERDDNTKSVSIKDFVGGDLENEMESSLGFDSLITTIVSKLQSSDNSQALTSMLMKLKEGWSFEDLLLTEEYIEVDIYRLMEDIKVAAAEAATQCELHDFVPSKYKEADMPQPLSLWGRICLE